MQTQTLQEQITELERKPFFFKRHTKSKYEMSDEDFNDYEAHKRMTRMRDRQNALA